MLDKASLVALREALHKKLDLLGRMPQGFFIELHTYGDEGVRAIVLRPTRGTRSIQHVSTIANKLPAALKDRVNGLVGALCAATPAAVMGTE